MCTFLIIKHDFWLKGTSLPHSDSVGAFRMWKLGKGNLFAKMLKNFEKWRKHPCLENAVSVRNFKNPILPTPPYLGIINLIVNFSAIPTLDEKMALFTLTEEQRDVNSKIVDL